jgi:ParB family chromosome partitioning protein
MLAEKSPDSHEQIRKYICLTELLPELLEMVDNAELREKDKPQIAIRPAVELSYLPKEQQQFVLSAIGSECCTPSHDQTLRMREKSKEGELDEDVILSIMQEEKPNQAEQFKLPKEKLSRFFAPGTPVQKIESDIIKGLELLQRQRERNRDAR